MSALMQERLAAMAAAEREDKIRSLISRGVDAEEGRA